MFFQIADSAIFKDCFEAISDMSLHDLNYNVLDKGLKFRL